MANPLDGIPTDPDTLEELALRDMLLDGFRVEVAGFDVTAWGPGGSSGDDIARQLRAWLADEYDPDCEETAELRRMCKAFLKGM